MTPITITLDFQQLAVVAVANLKLKNPYDLNIAGEAPNYTITVTEKMGIELIRSVEIMLNCFEKNHFANTFGNVCEELIDIFDKYGFS